MLSFLKAILTSGKPAQTILVVGPDSDPPQRYDIRPRRAIAGGVLLLVLLVGGTVALFMATPVKTLLPGFPNNEDIHHARLTELRIAALEDSLITQQAYMRQLRYILTGEVDVEEWDEPFYEPGIEQGEHQEDLASEPSADWADHRQPALPLARMPATVASPFELAASAPGGYLSALRLPVEPPVEGFVTRHFDARRGHFGIDIAASAESAVRAIGDGYVIMADWTHEAGWVIALQHAAGYVSIYKHNQRLLKQVGDRVRERESIAESGDTGLLSSGPHLHFELWHDGLAQDPRQLIAGY